MPAACAHITLVNLAAERRNLARLADFPAEAGRALGHYLPYCELGAIGPDYPYLSIGQGNTVGWADLMHYERTGEMIKAGIGLARASRGETLQRRLAWLLGYAAHVVMDVTVHPVIELKVGPYEENKDPHRICEMHQDAYIFPRLNLGHTGMAVHLDAGIAACSAPADRGALHPDIRGLWLAMFEAVYPRACAEIPPDPDAWHQGLRQVVARHTADGHRLFAMAHHVKVGLVGLTYPTFSEIDRQYILGLETPIGRADYDAVFDYALDNVIRLWRDVAAGVLGQDDGYLTTIGNWNLDTGRDESGRLAYWA